MFPQGAWFRGGCAVCLADGEVEGSPTFVSGFEPVFCVACAKVTCRDCVNRRSHNVDGCEMHECPSCKQAQTVHFSDAHPFKWLITKRQRDPARVAAPATLDAPTKQDLMRRRKAIGRARASSPAPHPTADERAPMWKVIASAPGARLGPTLPRQAGLFSETAPIDAYERFRDPPAHHRVFERTCSGQDDRSEKQSHRPPMVFGHEDSDPIYIKPAVHRELESLLANEKHQGQAPQEQREVDQQNQHCHFGQQQDHLGQQQHCKQDEATDTEELLESILKTAGRVRPLACQKRPPVPSKASTEKWYETQRAKVAAHKLQQKEQRAEKAIENQIADTFCSWSGEPKAMGATQEDTAARKAAQQAAAAKRRNAAEQKEVLEKEQLKHIEAQEQGKQDSAISEQESEAIPRVIIAWRERPKNGPGPTVVVAEKSSSPPVSPPVLSTIDRLADPTSTLGGYERWEANETRRKLCFDKKTRDLEAKNQKSHQTRQVCFTTGPLKQTSPTVSVNDMTKLAYGGYSDPAKTWTEQHELLNQWAEIVPAVLPRSSPIESWGLSAALTAELREKTYGKDQSRAADETITEKCPTKTNETVNIPRCSRMTLQQLSQPKRVLSGTRAESNVNRPSRQSTSRCRPTQLNGVSPTTLELWNTGNDRLRSF